MHSKSRAFLKFQLRSMGVFVGALSCWFLAMNIVFATMPTWLGVTIAFGIVCVYLAVEVWLVSRLRDQFPPTAAPHSKVDALSFAIFQCGVIIALLFPAIGSEAAIAGTVMSIVIWLSAAFGYGALGRELSNAVKQEEQESWRN